MAGLQSTEKIEYHCHGTPRGATPQGATIHLTSLASPAEPCEPMHGTCMRKNVTPGYRCTLVQRYLSRDPMTRDSTAHDLIAMQSNLLDTLDNHSNHTNMSKTALRQKTVCLRPPQGGLRRLNTSQPFGSLSTRLQGEFEGR